MPIGVRVVTIFVWSRLTSERRASNQRNQRESSDKHLHDTSPCYGRSSVGCCNSGEADGDRQRDALARRDPPAWALRAGKGKIESVRNAPLEDGKMIGERQHRLHHMQIMQARRVSFRRHRLESESKLVSQLGERGKSLAQSYERENLNEFIRNKFIRAGLSAPTSASRSALSHSDPHLAPVAGPHGGAY